MPTGNEDLIGALTYGQSICWNESVGYSQTTRLMNPNVDCSSFIWYCLYNNGFDVGQSPWYTGDMDTRLINAGFTEIPYDSSYTPVNGDILMYHEVDPLDPTQYNGHTFFYGENYLGYVGTDWQIATGTTGILAQCKIEASGTHNHPEDGDQDNGFGAHTEVWVHAYNSLTYGNHNWRVFRWGQTPPTPTGSIPAWLIQKIQKKRRNSDNGYDYY